MKTLLIFSLTFIVTVFLCSGCLENVVEYKDQPEKRDANGLRRYETQEVICYESTLREGIWCHWKGAP